MSEEAPPHTVSSEEDQYLDVKTLTGSFVEENQRLQHTPSTRSHNSNTSIGRLLDIAKSSPSPLQAMNHEVAKDKARLSLMLESLNSDSEQRDSPFEDADEIIVNPSPERKLQRSPERAAARSPQVLHQQLSYSDLNLASDSNYHSANQSLESFEFEKPENRISRQSTASTASHRKSLYSDYTPSIHEVEEVQVVNQDHSSSSIDVKTDSSQENSSSGSKKPVALLRKVVAKSSDDLNKSNISLHTSDIFSDSSKNIELESSAVSTNEISNQQLRLSSKDSSYEVPLGELNTNTANVVLPQDSDRSRTTDLNPSIPSRSPNRPSSSTAHGLRDQLRRQRPHSMEIKGMDNLLHELNLEVSRPGSEVGAGNISPSQERNVSSSSPRPLPPPPLPTHRAKPSVTSNIAFEEPLVSSPPLNNTSIPEASNENDDGFVTEEEEEEENKPQTKTTAKSHKRRSTKSTRSRQSHATSSTSNATNTTGRRSMNHETLMKLLQVTEGTIIGQEFQDLGLDDSEKQLLERLVDSLSRLTADMIIDGDRKVESIKRLSRAIKALEGF